MIYILIIVLGSYTASPGGIITAEFNSLDACEMARQRIVSETYLPSHLDKVALGRSDGCYAKGYALRDKHPQPEAAQ